MDFKTAKSILGSRLSDRSFAGEFSEYQLHNAGWYLSATADDEDAMLDGKFTADELEAIAAWMRNPKACLEA